jgi:hypothetical protein
MTSFFEKTVTACMLSIFNRTSHHYVIKRRLYGVALKRLIEQFKKYSSYYKDCKYLVKCSNGYFYLLKLEVLL